jgi:tetratricopeptide (TPR) repeat protein
MSGSALDAAYAALDAGEEATGLAALAPALLANPGDARLWQAKALLERGRDDLAAAVAAFDRAAALAPNDARIALGHAQSAAEAGLPAVALFERARRLAPGDRQVLTAAVAALLAESRTADALAELDTALAASPDWAQGHWLAARLRFATGDRDGYTASFDRALAQRPRDAGLWHTLIFTLMHARQYRDALAVIDRARRALGDQAALTLAAAGCHSELGELDAADRAFVRLPPPTDGAGTVQLVRHLLRRGRPADAARVAERVSGAADGYLLTPYLAVAWRLTGDPRWRWLEDDPRFIGVYDLADLAPGLPALADRLRELHILSGQPLEQSVRLGTQTDGPLFSRIEPEIRTLRAAIVGAVERHVAQLPPVDPGHPLLAHRRDRPVRFAGAWSVRLTDAGHHANHVHPAGWISSACYIVVPDPADAGAPPAGWLQLGVPDASLGLDLPPIREVEPKPGRLVLFPSTMWHGTVPFTAGERLTVAFDVAPPR